MFSGLRVNCRPCAVGDQLQDTVKVDPTLLGTQARGKENAEPLPHADVEEQRRREKDEEEDRERQCQEKARQLAMAAAAERQREAQEAREREVEEELVLEKRRVVALEEQREWEAHEAERLEREAKVVEEAHRADEQRVEKERADEERLQAYLAARNYSGVNDKRKSMFKFKRPLHSAVKENDREMVAILLQKGADATMTNSAGKTARQLAEDLEKKSPGLYAATLHEFTVL